MVEVKEVKTRKQVKEFLNFALEMYKGNPYFVPPMYSSEKKLFGSNHDYCDQAESVFYLAYRDGKVVGRISGILQRASNDKWNQKRVRFTRFDCIDDQEVANALFCAVEQWAKDKGMCEVVGPLGYSDMEREGLLVEGFDQLNTYEEQYNFPYYEKLVKGYGFEQEIEWVEYRLTAPSPEYMDKMKRISDKAMERGGFRFGEAKSTKDFLKKYADDFFDVIDKTYGPLYGTVPFTEKMKKSIMKDFALIIDLRYVFVILDKNDRPACFGLCFPGFGKALQKSSGKLTPSTIVKVLQTVKKPESIDLGLIGILPEYRNTGISHAMLYKLAQALNEGTVKYAETNLMLTNNYNILNQWKNFNPILHKRRRTYCKRLDGTEVADNPPPASVAAEVVKTITAEMEESAITAE